MGEVVSATGETGDGKVVLDIWGGECCGDHLARFIRPKAEALRLAAQELDLGFLVNLRTEIAWGTFTEFDNRSAVSVH